MPFQERASPTNVSGSWTVSAGNFFYLQFFGNRHH